MENLSKPEKKMAIRTYFETHMQPATEVAKKFNIPTRTMFHWVRTEKWLMGVALDKADCANFLQDELLKHEMVSSVSVARNNIKQSITDNFKERGVDYSEAVVEENVDEALLNAMSRQFIDKTLVETGLIAKRILKLHFESNGGATPKAMSMAKDLTSIWIDIKKSIHGSNDSVINIANYNGKEIKNEIATLSDDEIRALLKSDNK